MKTKMILFAIIALLMGGAGCNKDDVDLKQAEGYIVGFDPCTIKRHYRIGYVIITADLKDTLITYNLSDASYKMPASVMCNTSDTLYKIPEVYFRNWPFFSDVLRYKYGIKFSYSVAKENEKTSHVCTTDIITLPLYPEVIIKSATKY